MTIDSLIQIIALIVAVYALVPRIRQLELKMRFGVMFLVSSILYLIAVNFLLYYPNLSKIGLVPHWPKSWAFYPSDTAYFTTLAFVLFLLIYYQSSKLSRNELKGLQELAEELLRRDEFPELISLLDRYWDRLIQFQTNNFFLPRIKSKLYKYILAISPDEEMTREAKEVIIAILEAADKKPSFRRKYLIYLGRTMVDKTL